MGSKHKNKKIAKAKRQQYRDQDVIGLVEDKAPVQPTQVTGFFTGMQEESPELV